MSSRVGGLGANNCHTLYIHIIMKINYCVKAFIAISLRFAAKISSFNINGSSQIMSAFSTAILFCFRFFSLSLSHLVVSHYQTHLLFVSSSFECVSFIFDFFILPFVHFISLHCLFLFVHLLKQTYTASCTCILTSIELKIKREEMKITLEAFFEYSYYVVCKI